MSNVPNIGDAIVALVSSLETVDRVGLPAREPLVVKASGGANIPAGSLEAARARWENTSPLFAVALVDKDDPRWLPGPDGRALVSSLDGEERSEETIKAITGLIGDSLSLWGGMVSLRTRYRNVIRDAIRAGATLEDFRRMSQDYAPRQWSEVKSGDGNKKHPVGYRFPAKGTDAYAYMKAVGEEFRALGASSREKTAEEKIAAKGKQIANARKLLGLPALTDAEIRAESIKCLSV